MEDAPPQLPVEPILETLARLRGVFGARASQSDGGTGDGGDTAVKEEEATNDGTAVPTKVDDKKKAVGGCNRPTRHAFLDVAEAKSKDDSSSSMSLSSAPGAAVSKSKRERALQLLQPGTLFKGHIWIPGNTDQVSCWCTFELPFAIAFDSVPCSSCD